MCFKAQYESICSAQYSCVLNSREDSDNDAVMASISTDNGTLNLDEMVAKVVEKLIKNLSNFDLKKKLNFA